MRSMWRCARRKAARPARPRPSSTARAPRRLKKGQKPRSAGLRCGQEGYGPQAPHPCRHARSVAERCRSFRRHPGPRRRGAGARPNGRGRCFPSSSASTPMAVIGGHAFAPLPQEPARGRSRSSNDPTSQRASLSCPNDGWSREPSPGSAAIDAFAATSNAMQTPSRPSSVSPWSASCSGASQSQIPQHESKLRGSALSILDGSGGAPINAACSAAATPITSGRVLGVKRTALMISAGVLPLFWIMERKTLHKMPDRRAFCGIHQMFPRCPQRQMHAERR